MDIQEPKREYEFVFTFQRDLDNNIETYGQIGKLYKRMSECRNKNILLDFSNVTFISANLFAPLGAVLDYSIRKEKHMIYVKGLSAKIKKLISQNGFNRHFKWESTEDIAKKCIKYEILKANTEQLGDFERYLILYIFEHDGIPMMSNAYRDRIIDNFLEIFNNVIDHAESEYVYVCGQFFYNSKQLKFSIVDVGVTFETKINQYFDNLHLPSPENTIEWALKAGNSTKTNSPGGIGLTTLMDFLKYNKGNFTIVSGHQYYVNNSKENGTYKIREYFPGTAVTIGINLDDRNLYLYDNKNDDTIVF